MLNENIKNIRKSKGLSQEELAIQLSVVRQTISKWEQGLSVPDANMLLSLSEALDTPVSTLLGETVSSPPADDLAKLAKKLEIINLQLAQNKDRKLKRTLWFLICLCVFILCIFALLLVLDSPYLHWDYSNPEYAVVGVALHVFEWFFVRISPLLLLAALACIISVQKKRR